MNHHPDDQPEAGDDHAWVTAVVAADHPPPVPETVKARLEAALADEVARRRTGATEDERRRAEEELRRRSTLGTFGSNPPSPLDKQGLGLRHHDSTAL